MKTMTTDAGCQSTQVPLVYHVSDPPLATDEIIISMYENHVPPFVENEMERLYENLYSSMMHFRMCYRDLNASTYTVEKSGAMITILLFRCKRGRVQVLNEVIEIPEEEVRRFAKYIFSAIKSVKLISFNAIQTDIREFPFPYQQFNQLEDIVLVLPDTAEEYMSQLGKSTRKTIKGYSNKLKRDFPSFRYKVYAEGGWDEQQVRDIVSLNVARMAGKNKVSAFDQERTDRIIDLLRRCGLVCVATIDGRVCAGSISYRVGKNYFMHICAHDPAYDDSRLGTIFCYLTICECISEGGKVCHLLWGRQEYKYRFLGIQQDLDHLVVYRSRLQMFLNLDVVAGAVFNAIMRQIFLWVHSEKNQEKFISRTVIKYVNLLKNLRRFKREPLEKEK